jgi:hypothetical protein
MTTEDELVGILTATMRVRDILFRTAAACIANTGRALVAAHATHGTNAMMQFATQLLWTAYVAVVSESGDDGVVVATMLPFTRGELGSSVSEGALASTYVLSVDCPAPRLSKERVRMMRCAVKDIVLAHCRLSDAQKHSLSAAIHDATPRRELLTPSAMDLVRVVRSCLALDNSDVLGSIARIERVAGRIHTACPTPTPHKSGLWCAAQVVEMLPDIPAVLRDVVRMTHIPSVIHAVHNAARDENPDEILVRASEAWRAAEGGLRRMMLDVRVLLRYTGNDAECGAVLASVRRHCVGACEAYACAPTG